MAKNDWARNAFRKAQNLMSRGYNDFEPATVVTKNDLSNLKNTLLDDDEILAQNQASWTNMENNPYGVDANPIMEASNEALDKAGVATPYAWTEDSTIEEITKDAEESLKKKYDIDQPEDPDEKNSFFGEWWDNFIDKVVPDMGMGEDDDQRIAIAGEAIYKLETELNNLPTNTTPLTRQEREAVTKKRNQLKSQIKELEEKKQSYLKEGAFYNQKKKSVDFHSLIQNLENEKKEGWTGDHWLPHKSAEGGNQTIAYGHKLSDDEQKGGYVMIEGQQVPFNQLTEDKAQQLYQQDWNKSEETAKRWFGKDWDILDENAKLYATELVYNMGNSVTQGKTEYKKFKQKAISGEDYLSEIGRTYVNSRGKRVPLTSRVYKLKRWNN